MYETIMNKHAYNQLGFYVKDLEQACREHSALFGSGPFFYMEPSTQTAVYKGKEIELTLQVAFGHYGNLQIEMEQVLSPNNPLDNPFAELGRYGFHHFSNWVEDVPAAIKSFANAGYEPLFTMNSGGGLHIAFIDCLETWGYYIEMHEPTQDFWKLFKAAHEGWDGKDPWRKFDIQKIMAKEA